MTEGKGKTAKHYVDMIHGDDTAKFGHNMCREEVIAAAMSEAKAEGRREGIALAAHRVDLICGETYGDVARRAATDPDQEVWNYLDGKPATEKGSK